MTAALRLDHDRFVCDRGSCMRAAEWVLPTAYLCSVCLPVYRDDPVALAISPTGKRRRLAEYERLAAAATLTYSFDEELVLSAPITPPGLMICDVADCDDDATALIDGAVICDGCMTRYARADGSLVVPVDHLRGGRGRREVRSNLYRRELARLARDEPRTRTKALDAILTRRLADTVEAWIELSVGRYADEPLDDA